MKLRTLVAAVAAMVAAVTASASPTYQTTMTVAGYSGTTTLSDFPVLVRISPERIEGFSYAQCAANGADIAFTDADGMPLSHEIDTWNTSGESLVWVKLSSLEGTATTFRMTWGDSEATASATSSATWPGYVGVWHMGEASGTCANSSPCGATYDAEPTGSSKDGQKLYAGGDSPVGGARQLSDSNVDSYLTVPNYDAENVGNAFMISAWFRMTSVSGYPRLFARKAVWTDTNGWEVEINGYTGIMARGASSSCPTLAVSSLQNTWRHIAVVYNGSTSTVYCDGKKIGDNSIATATDNGRDLWLGAWVSYGVSMDECRLLKGAASADWVKAEYDTVKTADFVTASGAIALDMSVLSVGSPVVKTTSDTTADVAVYISSLGDGATKATVTLAYGADSASLAKTVTKEVTGPGRVTLTIAGLRPNYGCAAKVTVANDAGASVTSDLLSVMTTATLDAPGKIGLYQTVFTSANGDWTKDYTSIPEGTDWTSYTDANRICRLELGAIAAYATAAQKYTSELWGDEVYWKENNLQFAYWGYFYMEAGKKYKFRAKIDDCDYVKVTDPVTSAATVLINDTSWNSLDTSAAYEPSETGWYPIEIRFSDQDGGKGGVAADNSYKNTTNMGWSDDNGATWNLMIDDGTGSRLRTSPVLELITLSENKEGSTLTGLTLTFPALEEACDLVAVWGATNGYETVEAWPHSATVASLAAGATTAVYTLPNTWGDDDSLVVRFYLKGQGEDGATIWSPVFYWYDTSAPVLENIALDGTRGDKLVVTGHLADFPGDACTLKVLTGTSPDALVNEWTDLESTPHTGVEDFSLTLFESDTSAARYLKPGETYYVCVVATANGVSARSEVACVMMGSAQATFASKSATVNSNKRLEYTFKGSLSYVGPADAASATKVSIWYGTTNDSETFVKLTDEEVSVADTTTFTLTASFPGWNTTYYWQFRAEATTAGGTASVVSRTAIASVTTTDQTTYTWKSAVAEGAWDDAANWSNDKSAENCLGYPDCTSAEAIFPAGATARVTLNRNFKVNQLYLNQSNCDVTLAKGAEATDDAGISANHVYPHGSASTITFDGIAVSSAQNHVTVASAVTLFKMTNGAKLNVGSLYYIMQAGAKVVLEKDSSISCANFRPQGANELVLNDSTLTVNGEYFYPEAATGGKMRFEGTHPRFELTKSYARAYTQYATSDYTFEFCIPEGGYEAAPIQGPANPTYRFGNHNTATNHYTGRFFMSVAEDSPAALKGRALTTPFANWPKKGMNLYAVKEGAKVNEYDAFNWSSETDPTNLTYSLDGWWIAVEEKFESGQWKSLDLTFDAAEADRDLYVAWGPADGGRAPGGWANSGTKAATIAAGETTCSYALPGSWGSDENKVIRFYFLDGNGAAQWSQTTTYRNPYKPVLGDVTASGAATDTTAGFTLGVESLGEEAKNLTVSVLYGGDVTALNQSQVVATKTEAGEYALTLAGLVPDSHYAVRVVVQNDWGVATTSDVFSVSTASSSDRFWNAGLSQTYFTSAHQVWTKDYTTLPAGTDWTNYTDANRIYRRELGTIMAYVGGNPNAMQYTSEVWGDKVYWPGNGGQWCYWGFFYMEAGKSYKFRTKIDDSEYVKVTNPDTQEETILINDTADSASVITSDAYAPTVTGWYPIEIRFSDGGYGLGGYDTSNNYKNTNNMGWSDDDGATWNLMLDDGTGSRLCTAGETPPIQVAERRANGVWQALDLTFDAAAEERDLYVVWGAAHGGNETNGWANVEVCAKVAAGATSASYALPSTWGTDTNRVVRFCFAKGGNLAAWSPSTYWHPANDPSIGEIALDGTGGDTLVVKGSVSNLGGADCTLKVLTGPSADELTAVWEGDDLADLALTASADGDGKDFSFSLFAAKDDARYLEPGSTVYACVVTLANGASARSATAKAVMANAATWAAAPTATTKQRMLKVTKAQLSDLGMAKKSVVTLWQSTDNKTFTEVEDCDPVEVTDTEAFTMQHAFEKWNTKYYWKLRATNVSAGGTATNFVETAANSYTTTDSATYTWDPRGDDPGSWTNAANWTADSDSATDCIGYPSGASTTAKFAEGAKATITLDKAWTISKLDLSAANVDVTFVLATNGVKRDDVKLSAGTFVFSGANGKLTLDGTRLATSAAITLGADYTLVLTNAAYLGQNGQTVDFLNMQGGTVLLSGESTLDVGRYKMDKGARTVLRDAYLISYTRTQWWNTDGKIPVLRFEGKHPKLTQTSYYFSAREGTTANLRIEFCVPAGGYDAAPLCSTGSAIQFGSYNKSGTESIYVETEGQASKTITTPLISWKNGIYKAGVNLASKPKKSAAFIWADATGAATDADSPNQLNLTLPGSSGIMLIIR